MLDLNVTLEQVEKSSKDELKKILKTNATIAGLTALKHKQVKHKKIKHIKYESLRLQPYPRSPVIQQEAQTISALRSKCVRTVRTNFSKMYKNRIDCPLQCNKEAPQVDTQEHLLTCSRIKIQNPDSIRIHDVFVDLKDQEHVGILISKILRERTRLLELETSLPGAILGQSAL